MKPTAALPHDLDRYFTRPPEGYIDVAIDKLVPTRARTDGIRNARRHMAAAYTGEGPKRSPVDVRRRVDGCFDIVDGNSTFAVALADGWPTIRARVIALDD